MSINSFLPLLAGMFAFPAILGAVLPSQVAPWAVRWWFGIVLTGAIILIGHGLGLPRPIVFGAYYVVVSLALVGSASHWLRTRRSVPGERRLRIPFSTVVVSALLAFQLLVSYSSILAKPLIEGDALAIWYNKAKAYDAWVTVANLPFRDYPGLGPVLWAQLLSLTNHEGYLGLLMFPTLYYATILGFLQFAHSGIQRAAACFLIPAISFYFYDGQYTNGYQDGFLQLCIAVAASICARLLTETDPRSPWSSDRLTQRLLWLALFFAGTAGLIKNEGSVLALIITASFLLFLLSNQSTINGTLLWRFGPAIAVFLCLLPVWPAILHINQVPVAAQGGAFTLESILGSLRSMERLTMIVPFYQGYWESTRTILVLALLCSAPAFLLYPGVRRVVLFLWLSIVLHSVFVLVVFLSTLAPLGWHLATAFNRLMFQHKMLYALILIVTVMRMLDPKPIRIAQQSMQVRLPPDAGHEQDRFVRA